jgi:hypothetical protein
MRAGPSGLSPDSRQLGYGKFPGEFQENLLLTFSKLKKVPSL